MIGKYTVTLPRSTGICGYSSARYSGKWFNQIYRALYGRRQVGAPPRVDCSQSPYFAVRSYHLGILMRAKLGRVQNARGKGCWRFGGQKNIFLTSPPVRTLRHFLLSLVSLTSRDRDGGQPNSPIDIYDLTEKRGL